MAEISDEELLARRKKVIIGAVVLLLVVLLIYLIGKFAGNKKEPEEESVLMEHSFENPQLIEGDKFDNLEEADRRTDVTGRGSSMAGAGEMWVALSGDTSTVAKSSSGDRGIDGMNAAFEERKRRDEEEARQAAEAARMAQTPPPTQPSYRAATGTPAGQTPPKPKTEPAPKKEEPQNPFATEDIPSSGDGWSRAGVSSLDDSWNGTSSRKGPVKCTFLDSRTIKPGEKITLRLLEPLPVDGTVLPENTQLSALVSITSGRLILTVTGFKLNNSIHVVNLVSYDSDGSRGLYCPEGNENIKKSTSRRAVNIGTSTMAGALASLAGQVVEAGVDAAQQASQAVSVNVLSGYVFYLVNESH